MKPLPPPRHARDALEDARSTAVPHARKQSLAAPARKMPLKIPFHPPTPRAAPLNPLRPVVPLPPSPPARSQRPPAAAGPPPPSLGAAARRARALPQSRRPAARPAAGSPPPSPANAAANAGDGWMGARLGKAALPGSPRCRGRQGG